MPSASTRERAALALLGYAGVYVLIQFVLVLTSDADFSVSATLASGTFVSPWLMAMSVGAALLVTWGGPTPMARRVVIGALSVLAVMGALGLLTWLAGLAVDDFRTVPWLGGIPLAGKVGGTFAMLLGLALLGAAGYFVYTLFAALPVPQRPERAEPVPPQASWQHPAPPPAPPPPPPPPPPAATDWSAPVAPAPPVPPPAPDDPYAEPAPELEPEPAPDPPPASPTAPTEPQPAVTDDDDRPIWRPPAT